MTVPVYLPYCVLTCAIGVTAAIVFGLRSALRNAGWTTYDRTVTIRAATITVVGWVSWPSRSHRPMPIVPPRIVSPRSNTEFSFRSSSADY